MKLLVCISRAPDTTSKISFDSSYKNFNEEGVQFILNPYDEWYALVRALELKESLGGSVDIIHVGGATSEILLRKALAIGADAAFRIDQEKSSSLSVAYQISEFIKNKGYDIVFTGKESLDHNGSEVGAMIAEMLAYPFISQCDQLNFSEGVANCVIEIDGGSMNLEVVPPFVLSAAKGLAEQRIPNMKGIIDAKKKPLEVIAPAPVEDLINLECFELPEAKSGVKMIDPSDIDGMVNIFVNELKLI